MPETFMVKRQVIPLKAIERQIHVIRDHKVMLDSDLAGLYGVTTKVLNQAVSRNIKRFPSDFMFKLTVTEQKNLRSQSVTSSWGGSRYAPRVFTEQGVAMLSSVLRSSRAIEVNIEIMRTFVRMREAMISHKDLTRRLNDMEEKYDGQFRAVFQALRQLMQPQEPKKRPIGFIHHRDKD